MSIDYEKLMGWSFPDIYQSYKCRDTILYALGLGFGSEPTNKNHLRFVYEKNLMALPTMGTVLGYPGPWLNNPETGVSWARILHGEQELIVHRTLPPEGSIIGRNRVMELLDKGDKGAILKVGRSVLNAHDEVLLCSMTQTIVCRGAGGFGGPSGTPPTPRPTPDREADFVCDLTTIPQTALIYRLSGDLNPLHVDPEAANKANFDRPILHGFGTFGIVGHALLKTFCGYNPDRLKRISTRFTAPFYPGETLRTEFWQDGQKIVFRAIALERQVVVLKNGYAEVSSSKEDG